MPRAPILLQMTRPGFLAITAVGCLLGIATAATDSFFSAPRALATLVLALLAHAGANVLNDYHDALNGADAANAQGLFPFTGGSRLIQDGVTTVDQTRRLAWALLALAAAGGLVLASRAGPALLWIGAAGLLLAWAYSAPPLALMAHGQGELAVAMAWALVVLGADVTQRGQLAPLSAWLSVGYGLLIAAILLVNGLPDRVSDAQVGKRTLAVAWGPDGAARGYAALVLLAHGWLLAVVLFGRVPPSAAWGLLSLPLSARAAAGVWRHRLAPAHLRPAIQATIAAAVVHGLSLAVGLRCGALQS